MISFGSLDITWMISSKMSVRAYLEGVNSIYILLSPMEEVWKKNREKKKKRGEEKREDNFS